MQFRGFLPRAAIETAVIATSFCGFRVASGNWSGRLFWVPGAAPAAQHPWRRAPPICSWLPSSFPPQWFCTFQFPISNWTNYLNGPFENGLIYWLNGLRCIFCKFSPEGPIGRWTLCLSHCRNWFKVAVACLLVPCAIGIKMQTRCCP